MERLDSNVRMTFGTEPASQSPGEIPAAALAKMQPDLELRHLVVRRRLDDALQGTMHFRVPGADGNLRDIWVLVQAEIDRYPDGSTEHSGLRVCLHIWAPGDVMLTRAELEQYLPPKLTKFLLNAG